MIRGNDNGFLSKNDTNYMLDRKLVHWGFPKPYQGLILLENPDMEDIPDPPPKFKKKRIGRKFPKGDPRGRTTKKRNTETNNETDNEIT